MLLEVGLIIGGIPVGWLLRKNRTAQKVSGEMLNWTVRALLFLLGLSLGSDDNLMLQLNSLGLRAAVISIFSIGGSVLLGRQLSSHLSMDEAKFSKADRSRTAQ